MARSGAGDYTLPLPDVVAGTDIESTWANTTLTDIETEMTDSLSRSGKGGMSAALRLASGTVSAPGLSFTSEADSGLYRNAADDIRFALSGADAWRVTAAGFQMYVSAAWTTPLFNSAQTITGVQTFSSDPIIPDEAYGAGWNGSLEPATKNAIYDQIQTLPTNSTAVLVTGAQSVAGVKTFSDHVTMASTKGVDWSANTGTAATGAATTSEVMSHYEEGTWTPALWDSSFSSSEGQTYSTQTGKFTRIGNVVFISGKIVLTSIGTLTGASTAYIGNLPFAAAASDQGGVTVTKYQHLNLTVAGTIKGFVTASQNYLTLGTTFSVSTYVVVPVSEISADGELTFYGHYFV